MDAKSIKKVELHLHLDGSIRPTTLSELKGITLEEAKEMIIAKDKCKDLNEYIAKFDEPNKIMQTKENLERISRELAEDLKEDNCIYAEIRFAPNKHTKNLSLDEVIDSVLKGLSQVDIKTNLILCMMRGDSFSDNKNIVDLAKKYLNKGVVAIDLAGAEGIFKTSEYASLFGYASSIRVPFTIHAGEADGVSSINSAISYGTTRIGHGVRSIEDLKCLNAIREKNILLEVCPTSNVQTNIVNTIKDHPIKYLIEYGIEVCINTDNRTVSNVTLTDEYNKLIDAFSFDKEIFDKLNINAINHAFISQQEKEKLIKEIKEV